jgi:hypothetical protein
MSCVLLCAPFLLALDASFYIPFSSTLLVYITLFYLHYYTAFST